VVSFIETDMTVSLPDEQKKVLASQIPMGRLGTVDEIAKAVLFLASDNTGYITAQTIQLMVVCIRSRLLD
jgi:3-oxoacyl-[acyl-carrier protein] reductase